ncbi:unnamed protein product [Caenorhabditis auriculariae]|uniref:VWFA domain-containing protein n=1 Tax=Caenorhabditis auriculariae TaxID=2777116 RepID=A0A8S1HUW9_9PELO|nr:unnamed protein product [Caenorhabditis auriculariae]
MMRLNLSMIDNRPQEREVLDSQLQKIWKPGYEKGTVAQLFNGRRQPQPHLHEPGKLELTSIADVSAIWSRRGLEVGQLERSSAIHRLGAGIKLPLKSFEMGSKSLNARNKGSRQEQFFESIPVVQARLICATASEDSAISACSKRAIFYDGKCKCKPGYTDANEKSHGPRGIKCLSCEMKKLKLIVGVVFDTSGSIAKRDYDDQIIPLVQSLYRATFGNYIILTQFSNHVTSEDFSKRSDVNAAVQEIRTKFFYTKGTTNTAGAIEETHKSMMVCFHSYIVICFSL